MKLPKWDIDEAEAVYWILAEAVHSATTGMREIYGFSVNRAFTFMGKDKIFRWCALTEELIETGNKCIEEFKEKKFRDKIINGFAEAKKKINKKIIEYKSKDLQKMPVDELFMYLKFFTDYYKENFSYGFFAEPFDFILPDAFKEVLSKYNISDDEFLDLAAIPDTSYLNKENQKLVKIAMKQKNGEDINKELKKHLIEHEWIITGHAGKKKVSLDYFKKRIKETIEQHKDLDEELKHLQNFEEEVKQKKKRIIDKYNFDKDALLMIDIVDEIGPLHDRRKENFVKTVFYCDDIREELGKRFDYSLEELQFLELKELLPLKEGKKLDMDKVRDREEFFLIDVDIKTKKFEIITGEKGRQIAEKETKEEYGEVDYIEGMCASKGKASGKVKIVFKVSDFEKMEKGDILFTGMTRPEMLPIMKKAAAIVTDEGGIACHAAIVSREFKIPCIIGTRIGTKLFKDNELVEVDADKGVARKIK